MALKDQEANAFLTLKASLCYKVIHFGLKNMTEPYQMVMLTTFEDVLHKMVGCYVDDLVVKSKNRLDHL